MVVGIGVVPDAGRDLLAGGGTCAGFDSGGTGPGLSGQFLAVLTGPFPCVFGHRGDSRLADSYSPDFRFSIVSDQKMVLGG